MASRRSDFLGLLMGDSSFGTTGSGPWDCNGELSRGFDKVGGGNTWDDYLAAHGAMLHRLRRY